MKFGDYVRNYFPARAIRVRVGDTESYMGRYCQGLKEMSTKQIQWLNNHKPIHIRYSYNELELVYRASPKYTEIVWG